MNATARLVGDVAEFRTRSWARQPHLHRDVDADLVDLLTLGDVDHLVTSTGLRTPQLRLARDGEVLAASAFTRRASLGGHPLTGLVDGRRVLDRFDDGTTLILQGLQRYWPPITSLLAQLERELGHPCQANAYLTPPGARGFDWHRDAHDVFVVQTHGRKAWEVREPHGVRELELTTGTCLYLPTGTPHRAHSRAEATLHVTIGVRTITWAQVLDRVTRTALADVDLDTPLPAGWVDDPSCLVDELATRLGRLGTALTTTDPGSVLIEEAERFHTTRESSLRGGLLDRLAVDEVDDDTLLVRRRDRATRLLPDGDHVRLFLGDRVVRIPGWVGPALEQVVASTRIRPVDLAEWLDPGSRLVLARRLVREGLLRIES